LLENLLKRVGRRNLDYRWERNSRCKRADEG
jgi:hypothetical protein